MKLSKVCNQQIVHGGRGWGHQKCHGNRVSVMSMCVYSQNYFPGITTASTSNQQLEQMHLYLPNLNLENII